MSSSQEHVRYIPLSYNQADSQASALRLVLAINPQWKDAEGNIEFVRFTDGITNTVRRCNPLSSIVCRFLSKCFLVLSSC